MELEPRPDTIQIDEQNQLLPRGPWSFFREALPGGLGVWGIQLIAAWVAFEALTGAAWATHIRNLAGRSALPTYWGELLTVRDIWEMAVNGGLKDHPTGFWTPLLGILTLLWVLWAGWQIQARTIGLKARLHPWLLGLLDALVIGLPPLLVLGGILGWILEGLGGTGIPALGWVDFVGTPLLYFSCASTFSLQWWFCRLDRAHGASSWHLGGWGALASHLGRSFMRLWQHPVQWSTLVVGGVLARLGLHFLVLLLAWYLGGGTPARVWAFLFLELLATAVCAWMLGWFLRVAALFWRQDFRIHQEVKALERMVEGD